MKLVAHFLKQVVFVLLVAQCGMVHAQNGLTALERAYLHRVIVKSPVLDQNLGPYLSYSGEVTKQYNKIDYDAIEQQILQDSTLLDINFDGIASASPGLLAEVATKIALWRLYKELKLGQGNAQEQTLIYQHLMQQLIDAAPSNALRTRRRQQQLLPSLTPLLHPNITMNEKIALANSASLNATEQLQLLSASNKAIIDYVETTAYQLFQQLGGVSSTFQSILLAAGEGSGTNGLLNEKEPDANGIPEQGPAKGVGLFTYELGIENSLNGEHVIINKHPIKEFFTIGDGKTTNVHFSIWGFNSSLQSTVVISTSQNSYLLFASATTKKLWPDSTYGRGKTFLDHIHTFEHKNIARIQEKINGVEGIKADVNSYTIKKEEKLQEIDRRQALINALNPDKKNYQKELASQQRKLNHLQEALVGVEARLNNCIEKQEALQLELEQMQRKLRVMQSKVGNNVLNYKIIDGLYQFEDGAIFDPATQDFQFATTQHQDTFSVRLIAIGRRPESASVDEVQLYVNVAEAAPIEVETTKTPPIETIEIGLNDVFDPDQFHLPQLDVSTNIEASLKQLIAQWSTSNFQLDLQLFGFGKGVLNDGRIYKDTIRGKHEMVDYPGNTQKERETAKQSNEFKTLRFSAVKIKAEEQLHIEIASFTDPVRSNLSEKVGLHRSLIEQFTTDTAITDNDVLSALRSFNIMEALTQKIVSLGKEVLPQPAVEQMEESLQEKLQSSKVRIGKKHLHYQDYSSLFRSRYE